MSVKIERPKTRFFLLEFILFLSGALVMTLELVGARVLAPYVGTSIFVWANLIGVILGALTIGYYVGGKIADKNTGARLLPAIFLCISAYLLLVTVVKDPLLYSFHGVLPDLRIRSLVAVLILFAPPIFLLGMIVPCVIKARITDLSSSGRAVGNLYAVSTFGSIVGCFLTGLVLLQYFGNTKILLACSVLMFLTFLLTASNKFLLLKIAAAVTLFSFFTVYHDWDATLKKRLICDTESLYHRVWIHLSKDDKGDPIKIMRLDNEGNSAAYLSGDDLVAEYLKYFWLVRHFNPGYRKVLMIGGAGYAFPINYLRHSTGTMIDVVELDPRLTELAKTHFGLGEEPRLTIYHEDGRTYLNETVKKYDAIFIDAFKSISALPYQLTTLEAAKRMFSALVTDGTVFMNIISAIEGKRSDFLRAEFKTFSAVFPQVFLIPVEKPLEGQEVQNVMLIACKSSKQFNFRNNDVTLNMYLQHRWHGEVPTTDVPVLTDDFAPVEHYLGKAVF